MLYIMIRKNKIIKTKTKTKKMVCAEWKYLHVFKKNKKQDTYGGFSLMLIILNRHENAFQNYLKFRYVAKDQE